MGGSRVAPLAAVGSGVTSVGIAVVSSENDVGVEDGTFMSVKRSS
jgi:hypothetical protein